jgi:hypothetical protein
MYRRVSDRGRICLLIFFCALLPSSVAYAETLQSTNFRFDESTVGAGGLVQSSSANFQGGNSLGDIAVGDSSSANFQVMSPARNSDDPALSVKINNSATYLGNFSAANPTMATASFSVSNYTAFGYVVQIEGQPPKSGSRTIPALSTEASSAVGTEQFGINLVANTSPQSIGANPDQGQFGFGVAHPDYATPNKFRYNNGDIIASAPKSSGVTTFTISYLVNVAPLTHGGTYRTNQTIIVVGTY